MSPFALPYCPINLQLQKPRSDSIVMHVERSPAEPLTAPRLAPLLRP